MTLSNLHMFLSFTFHQISRFYLYSLGFGIILLLFNCNNSSTNPPFVIQDHFSPFPNEITATESGVAPSTMAGQAMKLYEEGRYDQAIILFNELIQVEGSVEQRYSWIFYKGNAEMAQGQLQNALTTFSYLPGDHPLYEESQWYRGLLFLQLGQSKEAKAAFLGIKNAHLRYEEARGIVREFGL